MPSASPHPPLSQLSLSSPTNTNMHTHKGNQIDMHTPPPPTISQTPLVFASPRPPTSLCSLPFYPPLPSPSIAESTGGNSRHMYGWLLCGRHDNRHEFDMALTYPGGCEPVWMQSFEWRSRIARVKLSGVFRVDLEGFLLL